MLHVLGSARNRARLEIARRGHSRRARVTTCTFGAWPNSACKPRARPTYCALFAATVAAARARWEDGRPSTTRRCATNARAELCRCRSGSLVNKLSGKPCKTMHFAPSPPTTRPNHHGLRASLSWGAATQVRGGSISSLCTTSGRLSRAARRGDLAWDDIHVPANAGEACGGCGSRLWWEYDRATERGHLRCSHGCNRPALPAVPQATGMGGHRAFWLSHCPPLGDCTPLLQAAAADLAVAALAEWRADPRSADWWEEARHLLMVSELVGPHTLLAALAHAVEAAPAHEHHLPDLISCTNSACVHIGWAVRQLREPDGYFLAPVQEALLNATVACIWRRHLTGTPIVFAQHLLPLLLPRRAPRRSQVRPHARCWRRPCGQ